MRVVLSLMLCGFLAACTVELAELEKNPTIRKLEFSGSHVEVSQCVEYRGLDGQKRTDPVGNRIILFDSVKTYHDRGITHYAMVFEKTSPSGGIVEFKKHPVGPMNERVLKKFWAPVEQCVKDLANRNSK